MRLLVIGATGPTGRELVQQGLELGHEITAVARNPETAGLAQGAKVVKADVMDAASMQVAVTGQDAVLSSLGSKLSRKPTTLFSEGTSNLIRAMKNAKVQRLVCITGIGAGDSKGHGGFLYDKIFQPLLLDEIYKDKTRQEELIRTSQLKWTIVRPGALTNGAKTGSVKSYTDLTGVTIGKISRADVAAFVLKAVGDETAVGKIYTIGN